MNPLSQSTVGFEALVQELQLAFQSEASWNSKLVSNMSTILTDMIAGTQDNSQRFAEFSAREGFLNTARRNSSVYALTRMLGVKVARRKSAVVSVLLDNPTATSVAVPAYSQIQVAGKPFYNRNPIVVNPYSDVEVTLYKGYVRTKTFPIGTADLDLAELTLGVPGFVVADHDLRVTTQDPNTAVNTEWTLHEGSILELSANSRKFLDVTLSDGDVSLTFGNNLLGKRLPAGHVLNVSYIESDGASGNTQDSVGSIVTVPNTPGLTGLTTSVIGGGAAIKDKVYYKKLAPHIYKSKTRLGSITDYKSNIAMYPGVADVKIVPQRESGPDDLRLMNVVKICILPETGLSWGGQNPLAAEDSPTWREFLDWAQAKVRPNTHLVPWNPTPIYIDISVEVAIFEGYEPAVEKSVAIESVKTLFKHRLGVLGRKFMLSDLEDAIKITEGERRESIDYIKIVNPTENVIPKDSVSYVALRNLNIFVRQTERKDVM